MAKKKSTAPKKGAGKAPVKASEDKAAVSKKTTPKAKPGDGPAENPKAVTGDNILSEDQLRMVFFNHLKIIKNAQAGVTEVEVELRAAKKVLKDAKKLAQSEGTSLVDIATALRLEDGDEKMIRAEIENRIKIARWLNIPMGHQLSLLDEDRRPAIERAFEEGKIAGLKGGSRKPPHDPSVPQHARWLEGYAEGQAVLTKKFKPLEKTDVPQGSKPKAEAASPKPETEGAGNTAGVAGAPSTSATAADEEKGKAVTTTAAPKTPPTPPAEDGSSVVSLQTGGKKA